MFVDREPLGAEHSAVVVDNAHGGAVAGRHLLEHGHTRIACIARAVAAGRARGRPADRAGRRRGRGGRRACGGRGLHTPVGLRAPQDLLERRPRPSAIFATADQQAIGALRAAADVGLRVPANVAVVSFHGISEGAYTLPGLTTVARPFERLGGRAVERLLEHVAEPATPPRRGVLPVGLVRRGSCGCEVAAR